jgi:hypothetical protein
MNSYLIVHDMSIITLIDHHYLYSPRSYVFNITLFIKQVYKKLGTYHKIQTSIKHYVNVNNLLNYACMWLD